MQAAEPKRRTRRIVIAVGAVIVLAAGAGTAWLYWSRQYQVGPSGSVPSVAAKLPAVLA